MATVSAKHFVVVAEPLPYSPYWTLKRRRSFWPFTCRVYYVTASLNHLSGLSQRRRRAIWGRKTPLPLAFACALHAAVLRDRIPVRSDTQRDL